MTSKDTRIVFMGTPEFAVETLRALVENGYNVVAVITVPDKPAGRGQKLSISAVKEYALSQNLKVLQPEKLRDEAFVAELRNLKADLQIVVAFRMLPEVVWNMPPLGTFNLHASLLPNYRGAAPINWAIINGEKKSGVTTFFIEHQIDTGNIIDQVEVDITDDMNVGELYDKLMHIGSSLVCESIDKIADGSIVARKQDETLLMRPAPKIFKDDCRIDWTKDAQSVHNLIRGLSPYPGSWSIICNGEKELNVKLFASAIAEKSDKLPGQIEQTKNSLKVSTADAWLEITEIQIAGKKRMKTKDLLQGFSFEGFSFV